MNSARARLALSATSSNSTRPAPTPASVSMKSIDQPAARRAGCPAGRDRHTAMTSASSASRASPLVSRWVSSMIVAIAGARGTISPLQSGQCWPQPAPEPVART